MPFHFCSDELFAIMAALPLIGALFMRVKVWWHTKFHHKKSVCVSAHHPCEKSNDE